MQREVTSPKSDVRMLTATEIESLQRDKEQAVARLMQEFQKSPKLLTPEELAALN